MPGEVKGNVSTLNGINPVGTITTEVWPTDEIERFPTIQEVRNQHHDIVPATDPLAKAIGNFSFRAVLMIFGGPGSGKSSIALVHANSLGKQGYRVAHVAREQYDSPTYTRLANRYDLTHIEPYPMLSKVPLSEIDILLIDSKDEEMMSYAEGAALWEKYDNIKYLIIVSKVTKAGDFKGEKDWEHLVDAMVVCKDMTAYTGYNPLKDEAIKNRWGGVGQVDIKKLIVNPEF